jgi:hypothetical protein
MSPPLLGEECVQTALTPIDRQVGQLVIGFAQVLLGRVDEGIEMLRRHRQVALANEWHYSALGGEPALGVSMLLRGDLKNDVRQLESTIDACENRYGIQSLADLTRLYLAEFYVALLLGPGKLSFGMTLKNLFFILNAKRVAAKKAEALLSAALRNPLFTDRGVVRARIDYNLGLLHKMMGCRELARAHSADARGAALAQQAVALVAKIDAAMISL